MAPKLTIQLVGWNSAKELPAALAVLKNLPVSEVVIRYFDNDSTDASPSIVRQMLPQARIIEFDTNRGFAGAHNYGFQICDTPLVMVHNPDLIMDWHGVKRLLDAFADASIAAVQGLLYRDETRTRIDSAGIVLSRALNGVERGANTDDLGQFTTATDLIAVTGAAGIYRVSALRSVALDDEVFDTDFFAYKEDVDLGWRLVNAGWRIRFIPVAMGVHARSLGVGTEFGWRIKPRLFYARLADRRTYYSLRNWVWMAMKNATFKQMLRHELFFDVRLLMFFLLSLTYWPLLRVWPEIVRGLPAMIRKRQWQSGQTYES